MTTLYELGYDYTNAIKEYNNLEREYGATSVIHYYRSLCYSEIGDSENAIKDINKCIEMGDGNDYYALSRRALIYEEAGLYDKAIADYTTLIEMEPMSVFLYYRRGWCYELAGDDRKAMEDYNAGVDIDKTYPYIKIDLKKPYTAQVGSFAEFFIPERSNAKYCLKANA
jgi:tetratricopeptide (TPR) repeat protein